jgi:hypothetical protein
MVVQQSVKMRYDHSVNALRQNALQGIEIHQMSIGFHIDKYRGRADREPRRRSIKTSISNGRDPRTRRDTYPA